MLVENRSSLWSAVENQYANCFRRKFAPVGNLQFRVAFQ
jgi:hypothetical protein